MGRWKLPVVLIVLVTLSTAAWGSWQWDGIDGLTVAAYSLALLCSAGSAWCSWRTAPYIQFKPGGDEDPFPKGFIVDPDHHENGIAEHNVPVKSREEVMLLKLRLDLRRSAYALRAFGFGLVGVITVVRMAVGEPLLIGLSMGGCS